MAIKRQEDVLWQQYEFLSGVYRFYLQLVITLNGFFYATSGALFGLVFTNLKNSSGIQILLFLPFGLSIVLLYIFMVGRIKAKELHEWMTQLERKITEGSDIKWNSHVEILTTATTASILTLLAFASVTLFLFIKLTQDAASHIP